jgi:hypothetical protein
VTRVLPKRNLGPKNCTTRVNRSSFASLKAIVNHYLANYSDNADRELRFYRRQRTRNDALEQAALARLPSGKRAHHQRRLAASILGAAWDALQNCDFDACRDFHDLICLIDETVRPIDGIGELYVYDTALRFGTFLRLVPDRIYLHAGVRVGARALGFIGGDYILCSDLPDEFSILQPHQIEDCLCIYKRELAVLRAR